MQDKTLTWRKSPQSNPSGNCVEIADLPDGGMAIRDSKDKDGPRLEFTAGEWSAFVEGIRDRSLA